MDPEKRTAVHNAGRGARYTRVHRPVRLVYTEVMPDRSSAQKRECVIKQMSHDKKKHMINKYELETLQNTLINRSVRDKGQSTLETPLNDMIGKL